MSVMQDPPKGFRHVIRWVDDSRDVDHDNVAILFPVLDGKVLDINVPRAIGGVTGIDELNGGLVVLVDWSRAALGETKLM